MQMSRNGNAAKAATFRTRVQATRNTGECVSCRSSVVASPAGSAMSREADEFRQLARRTREKANARTDELRGLLLAIVDAYVLLAHLQEALDEEHDTPPRMH